MKRILYLRTHYQVIVALQMTNTIFKDDQITLLISDDSNGANYVVEQLLKMHVVEHAVLVQIKKLNNNKSLSKKVVDLVSVPFLRTNQYKKFIKSILNEFYDEFIFYNFCVDATAFYNLLSMNNQEMKVSCIEEGLFSYDTQIGLKHGKIMGLSYHVRKFFGKSALQDHFTNFYCYYPELYHGALTAIQVPCVTINSRTSELLKALYKPDFSQYNKRYIFFTSVYDFEGGEPIGEYELVSQIADLVGKENLLVKTHPRDVRNIYAENGFYVDTNSAIPWEVIQLGYDFSNCVFMTVNSGSVLAGSFMSDKPVRTFYMFKLCNLEGNPSCQKNAKDIKAMLENQFLKNLLSRVSIANKLEDIIDE